MHPSIPVLRTSELRTIAPLSCHFLASGSCAAPKPVPKAILTCAFAVMDVKECGLTLTVFADMNCRVQVVNEFDRRYITAGQSALTYGMPAAATSAPTSANRRVLARLQASSVRLLVRDWGRLTIVSGVPGQPFGAATSVAWCRYTGSWTLS